MRACCEGHRRKQTPLKLAEISFIIRLAGKDQLVLIKRNNVQICTKPPIGWLTVLMASPALPTDYGSPIQNRHPEAAGFSHSTPLHSGQV